MRPTSRPGQAPKHFLTDPAFAARLLRLTPDRLHKEAERHAAVIGQLWESLVAMSVRVFAQPQMAEVRHLRTQAATTRSTSSSKATTAGSLPPR